MRGREERIESRDEKIYFVLSVMAEHEGQKVVLKRRKAGLRPCKVSVTIVTCHLGSETCRIPG